MDPAAFGDDESWYGGFYELAVLLGPRDGARLDNAIRAGLGRRRGTSSLMVDYARPPRQHHLE